MSNLATLPVGACTVVEEALYMGWAFSISLHNGTTWVLALKRGDRTMRLQWICQDGRNRFEHGTYSDPGVTFKLRYAASARRLLVAP